MTVGFDFLGAANKHFLLKPHLKAIPKGSAVGFFLDEFGPVLPEIRKCFREEPELVENISAIRFHLWWGGRMHVIVPLDVLADRAPSVEKFAKDFPSIKIYLSHSCEHTEKNKVEVRKRMHLCEKLAPSCVPVNCPWTGAVLKNYINEFHDPEHAATGDYITSTDGCSEGSGLYDIDARQWNQTHKHAVIRFAWGSRYNLREVQHSDDPTPIPEPKDRTEAPSVKYTKSLVRITQPKLKAPKLNFDTISFTGTMLWKSHSEDIANSNEPRENKPIAAIPAKGQYVEVVDCKKNVLGKLIYVTGQLKGQNRFYSGVPGGINLWGFEIGQRALESSGSEFVCLKDIAGNYYGPFNPAFREGYYHK